MRKKGKATAPLSGICRPARCCDDALRDCQSRYQLIFELNPCPMYIMNEETLEFLAVNVAALRLYGYSREAFLSMTVKDIRPPADVKTVVAEIRKQRRLLRGEPGSRKGLKRKSPGLAVQLAAGEWRHVKRDGTVFTAEITVCGIPYDGCEARLVLVKDITERKQAEEELSRAAREWTATFDGVSDAVWVLDSDQRIRRCNKAAEKLFKLPLKDMVGRFCWEIAHRAGHPAQICPFSHMAEGRHRESFELQMGERWYQVMLDPLIDGSGTIVGAVHIFGDITVRKRAEADVSNITTELERRVEERTAELRRAGETLQHEIRQRCELEREVLEISERVQRRLGQDLHDGVGQSIIGIGYLISAVQQTLARKSAPEAAELGRIAQIASKTVQQARDLARGLFPEIKGSSLSEALYELALHTQDVFGISCRYTGVDGLGLSDANTATQMYRIVQEAVNNAAKHSKAKTIKIGLSQKNGSVFLTVRDTGVGMDQAATHAAGMGRRIMSYRADLIGATLKIVSASGKGTTVTCVLPPPSPPAWIIHEDQRLGGGASRTTAPKVSLSTSTARRAVSSSSLVFSET